MEGKASRKNEGGKLVRVKVVYDDKIRKVEITGDFFLEPPESLKALEKALEGCSIKENRDEMLKLLEEVDAELIGFSREDIIDCLEEVVR